MTTTPETKSKLPFEHTSKLKKTFDRPHPVRLLPGSQFGYPGNHFRIGFGRENMPEALARLEAFVEGQSP